MRAFGSYLPHCDGTNSPPLTPPLRRGRGGGRFGPLGLATPARIRFGALPPALPAISEDMANRRARRDEMTAQLNEDVFLAGVVNEAHALVYLQSVDTRSAIKAVERELTGTLGHIGDDNARRHPSFIPEERAAYNSVDGKFGKWQKRQFCNALLL